MDPYSGYNVELNMIPYSGHNIELNIEPFSRYNLEPGSDPTLIYPWSMRLDPVKWDLNLNSIFNFALCSLNWYMNHIYVYMYIDHNPIPYDRKTDLYKLQNLHFIFFKYGCSLYNNYHFYSQMQKFNINEVAKFFFHL